MLQRFLESIIPMPEDDQLAKRLEQKQQKTLALAGGLPI